MKHFKKGQHRQAYAYYHGIRVKDFPRDDKNRVYEIHHLDGNSSNNSKDNLILVSIYDHFMIHKTQQDWGACYMFSVRMKMSAEEISRFNSLQQQQRVLNGTHHLLSGEIQKRTTQDRLLSGTHNFQGKSGSDFARELSLKRVKSGTHNFLGKQKHSHPNNIKVLSVFDGKITSKTKISYWNAKNAAYVGTWVVF